jgi:hypothetical protein
MRITVVVDAASWEVLVEPEGFVGKHLRQGEVFVAPCDVAIVLHHPDGEPGAGAALKQDRLLRGAPRASGH